MKPNKTTPLPRFIENILVRRHTAQAEHYFSVDAERGAAIAYCPYCPWERYLSEGAFNSTLWKVGYKQASHMRKHVQYGELRWAIPEKGPEPAPIMNQTFADRLDNERFNQLAKILARLSTEEDVAVNELYGFEHVPHRSPAEYDESFYGEPPYEHPYAPEEAQFDHPYEHPSDACRVWWYS